MSPRPWRQIRQLGGVMVGILTILALATPTVAQEEPDSETVTITLNEVDDSGVSGIAMLSANDDQTDVAIRLTGAFGDHPNHIHENFCDEVNPVPLLPLQHVVVGEADPDGFTNSTVDIWLDELLAGEFSILVHRSDDQLDDYLVCGNITTDYTENTVMAVADQSATGTGRATVSEMPTSGVGTAAQGNLGLLAVVVGLAGVSVAIAIAAARKPQPR